MNLVVIFFPVLCSGWLNPCGCHVYKKRRVMFILVFIVTSVFRILAGFVISAHHWQGISYTKLSHVLSPRTESSACTVWQYGQCCLHRVPVQSGSLPRHFHCSSSTGIVCSCTTTLGAGTCWPYTTPWASAYYSVVDSESNFDKSIPFWHCC